MDLSALHAVIAMDTVQERGRKQSIALEQQASIFSASVAANAQLVLPELPDLWCNALFVL